MREHINAPLKQGFPFQSHPDSHPDLQCCHARGKTGNPHGLPDSRHNTPGAQLELYQCQQVTSVRPTVRKDECVLPIIIVISDRAEKSAGRQAAEASGLLVKRKFGRKLHPVPNVCFETVHEVVPLACAPTLKLRYLVSDRAMYSKRTHNLCDLSRGRLAPTRHLIANFWSHRNKIIVQRMVTALPGLSLSHNDNAVGGQTRLTRTSRYLEQHLGHEHDPQGLPWMRVSADNERVNG